MAERPDKLPALFARLPVACAYQQLVLDERGEAADAIFRAVNPAFAALVGLKPEAIIGRLAGEILPGWAAQGAELAAWLGRAAAGQRVARHNGYLEHGERRLAVAAARVKPDYLLVVYDDVTHLHRLEGRSAAAAVGEARRQERERRPPVALPAGELERLGVLAGGIARDFNNLLVGVLGNVDLALRRLPAESPAVSYLRGIEAAARQAAELTEQLLVFAGRGGESPAPLDLSRLVREMYSLLRAAVPRRVVLEPELSDSPVPVRGVASQLQLVARHLVTNAAEAIGDRDGLVRVSVGLMSARREWLDGASLGRELAPGEYAFLEVADNGRGMDAETRARLFEPGFSRRGPGHGLGLAIVLGVVGRHGGAIRVESAPRAGSTVRVLLPPGGDSVPAAKEAAPPPPPPAGWRGRGAVLVIDDDEAVRRVATAMLEEYGFTPLVAADAQSGLALCRERLAEIVLVLLDLSLPLMSGEDAFQEIRKLAPGLPVLLISGHSEWEVAARLAGRGEAEFLRKPFTADGLIGRVRSLLGEA